MGSESALSVYIRGDLGSDLDRTSAQAGWVIRLRVWKRGARILSSGRLHDPMQTVSMAEQEVNVTRMVSAVVGVAAFVAAGMRGEERVAAVESLADN